MDVFDDVDVSDLIDFGRAWRSMGDAVAEQVMQVVQWYFDGADAYDLPSVNPNAIDVARDRISHFHSSFEEAFDTFDNARG